MTILIVLTNLQNSQLALNLTMARSSSSLFTQYPYPSTLNVSNFVSIKLSKANYLRWKTQIYGLLGSQDLLGFIDGTNPAPAEMVNVPDESSTHGTREIENPDYMFWRRSDRLVKGWIIGSLSEDFLDMVVGLNTTARDAWTQLENSFIQYSQEQQSRKEETQEQPSKKEDFQEQVQSEKEEKDVSRYLPLFKAALRGDWESAQRFIDQDGGAVTATITANLKTALHLAVGTGKSIHFVEKLVELMPTEAIALRDQGGDTALMVAAMTGNTRAAVILVNKNPALPYITNESGLLPVHKAAYNGKRDTLLYLLTVTKDDIEHSPLKGQSGAKLLIHLIVSGFLDVALDLVQRYPNLARLEYRSGDSTPLKTIAKMASAFPSGSRLNFWEHLVYSCVPVKLKNHTNNSNGSDVENPADSSQVLMRTCGWIRLLSSGNHFNTVNKKLLLVLWRVIGLLVPSIKHIQDQKLIHHQALHLVKCLCKEIKSSNDHHSRLFHFGDAALLAAHLGIHEVVEEIMDTYPYAIRRCNKYKHYIFQTAVVNRCEKVFNLVYQMSELKNYITTLRDTSGNNILHLAGRLAPLHKLNLVSGAALQMQRELQWFKEVEKFVNPGFKMMTNSTNETPEMVFTKEHKDLMIQGEKWMKDTANSCTITAALIATIAFAAAITVPGGNNEDSGLPILSKLDSFRIFIVSVAISLFTSTTSLLMFLSILTSRYTEADFLHVLPKRLIIGLVTLFLSITSLIIAFNATLYLMVGRINAWILIPVDALACLPVISFLSLQFPLLVDVISSTYGPGIFGKQSERPFF